MNGSVPVPPQGTRSLSVSVSQPDTGPLRHARPARSFHATCRSAHAPLMHHNKPPLSLRQDASRGPLGSLRLRGADDLGGIRLDGTPHIPLHFCYSLSALGLGLAGPVALGVVLVVASGAGAALARVGHLTA